jgi:crotonobetainyl-CoA:carnitine CoA-transferase CaiB-like acyl-CoA transferase
VKVGSPVTDITCGIIAAMGVLAALNHRNNTGVGQLVDTSLFEAGIVHTYWQSAICFATGTPPGPMGSAHPLNGPYQAFPTTDGWINIGAANQRNWERLLEVLGAPELNQDMRFANNPARMANLKALEDILNEKFRARSSADWLAVLEKAGVPAGPVLNVAQMHADPQTQARSMVVEAQHPVAGNVRGIGLPVKFSESPGGAPGPAPVLGQHTREVLAEHGFGAAEIDAMAASGAIGAA